MMDLQERINRDGFTAEATWRDAPPSYIDSYGWGRGSRWFDVTLRYGGRTLTVPFGQGPAHTEDPTAADVIDCLASDSATYDNANGFEDWAADLGFDTDSRKAEKTYNTVAAQRDDLAAFLGDQYDAYLYQTERL